MRESGNWVGMETRMSYEFSTNYTNWMYRGKRGKWRIEALLPLMEHLHVKRGAR